MFNKAINWFQDHYHILFKSAADNHLRIQNILKNSDGSYQLTLKFGSYTELKKYQQKVRRLTVSLSSAVAMVIVALVISPYILHPNKSAASTFLWNQNNWSTHTISPETPDNSSTGYPADPNWSKYYTKTANVTAGNGSVTMTAPNPNSVGDSSYSSAPTGFYASGGSLVLKKVDGATCGGATECKTGFCNSLPQCGKVANGGSCGVDGDCTSSYCGSGTCKNNPWTNVASAGCGISYALVSSNAVAQTTLATTCAGLGDGKGTALNSTLIKCLWSAGKIGSPTPSGQYWTTDPLQSGRATCVYGPSSLCNGDPTLLMNAACGY